MKVVLERVDSDRLRVRLMSIGAKERQIEDTVVVDAETGKVSIRPALRTVLTLESGVIVHPGIPGEACATFDGGYHQVVGLLLILDLFHSPISDEFPTYSQYSHSIAVPA